MATIFETMHIRNLTNKWEQRKQNYTKQAGTDDRTPEQRQMDSMMEMLKRERDSTQRAGKLQAEAEGLQDERGCCPCEDDYAW